MLIIRPIQTTDLDALHAMAAAAGKGMTTLPPDRKLLASKIRRARDTFDQRSAPEAGLYLFALEDTRSRQCVGVSGIQARVGLDEVFYNYRLSTTVNASRELGVYVRTPTLILTNDMTDATEVGSLLLDKAHRGGGNGLLLSRCRFLFLDEFRRHFSDKIFAEMRGVSDDQGRSPLWEALGQRFFDMEFGEADHLSALGNKSFIAELMPRFPIYLPLLPASARAVIGRVHDNTGPALNMLQAEGFNFNGLVDIFDGGPVVEVFLDSIRSIRQSRLRDVVISPGPEAGSDGDPLAAGSQLMISNRSFRDLRITTIPRDWELTGDETGQVRLTPAVAEALQVVEGDPVRVSPLKDVPS